MSHGFSNFFGFIITSIDGDIGIKNENNIPVYSLDYYYDNIWVNGDLVIISSIHFDEIIDNIKRYERIDYCLGLVIAGLLVTGELPVVNSFLEKYVGKNAPGLAVDIGANVGITTRVISEYFKDVVAFEPQSDLLSSFKHINFGCDGVLHKKCAVGDLDVSTVPFNLQTKGESEAFSIFRYKSSVKIPPKHSEVIEVNYCKIDDWVERNQKNKPLSFMKVDVEGYEVEVLRGASATIEKDRPILLIETAVNIREILDMVPAGYVSKAVPAWVQQVPHDAYFMDVDEFYKRFGKYPHNTAFIWDEG